jgi:hypothetical protein
MNIMRRILLVFVLFVLAVGYLYQHSCSMRLTRSLSRLETQRQLLAERLDSVDAEVVKLSSFARMESLWVAQGRPTAPSERPGPNDNQPVALAQHQGTDEAAH